MRKLFGWLFLLAGLTIGLWLGSDLYRWQQARGWQPVSAELLHVALQENQSDDSTTWRVTARYQYDYAGHLWQSDQVAIADSADNIGDFQQRLYAQLNHSWQQQQPVTAWVNPARPQQALLNRELRPGLLAFKGLFPLIFGGIGLAVLLLGRRARTGADNAGKHNDQPWLGRRQWQSTSLVSAGRSSWIAALVMALLWIAVSMPLLFVLPDEIADGNHAALIGLLFPLVGVGLMIWALRAWLRWRRYGQSRLQLDTLPVALGGVLRAALEIPGQLSSRSIQAQLLCVRKTVSGSGKNRRTSESILWENQYDFAIQVGANKAVQSARVVIPLPDGQPVSDWHDQRQQIIWRLRASASEPGVDYASQFELPVFAVEHDQADADSTPELPPQQADLWRDTGVQHGYVSHGQRFYWPRYRLLAASLWVLLAGLIFGGVGVVLLLQQQAWLMGGVFVLIGLLIVWGAVTMLFQRSEITFGQGQLRYAHGLFGGEKVIPLAEIRQLSHKRSASIGYNTYYRIELQRWGSEKTISIADWIPGERQTAALVRHLQSML